MATVTLSPPSTRRSNSFRIVSAIVIFFLVVVALVVVSFVWVAKASLPQLDGQLKVVGLRAPVTILPTASSHAKRGPAADMRAKRNRRRNGPEKRPRG